LTMFGLVFIGGRNYFFDIALKNTKVDGIRILERMILVILWPIYLHFIALGFLIVRMFVFDALKGELLLYTGMLFRFVYTFVASWALIQSVLSVKTLFRLSLMRLRWRKEELSRDTQARLD